MEHDVAVSLPSLSVSTPASRNSELQDSSVSPSPPTSSSSITSTRNRTGVEAAFRFGCADDQLRPQNTITSASVAAAWRGRHLAAPCSRSHDIARFRPKNPGPGGESPCLWTTTTDCIPRPASSSSTEISPGILARAYDSGSCEIVLSLFTRSEYGITLLLVARSTRSAASRPSRRSTDPR